MTYKSKRRDEFVWAVCNWLINTFATKEYRAFITVLIAKGRAELDRELGVELLRDSYELADHVEAIKKYLKENELPDMTRRAFIADLHDVLKEVGDESHLRQPPGH